MTIDELKQEYATQDNRATAYPIYVTVQELKAVGVIDEDYVNGSEDSVIKYFNSYEEEPREFDSLDEIHREFKGRRLDVKFLLYRYEDVEVFLTIKGALEYIERDRHNLRKPRTYVKHFSRRNTEIRGLLEHIGFRVKD